MLRQSTIKAYSAAMKELDGPVEIAEYARDLISEDYAPCFADRAGQILCLPVPQAGLPPGKISAANSAKVQALEEELEAEWWRDTGDALLAELLGEKATTA